MVRDLISRTSLAAKLEEIFCSNCAACDKKCRYNELLKLIQEQPTAYDANWVERRIHGLFKHHRASKTVQRLVLENLQNGYSAAADADRYLKGMDNTSQEEITNEQFSCTKTV